MVRLFLTCCFFKSERKPTSRSKNLAEVAPSPRVSSSAPTPENTYNVREPHNDRSLASLDDNYSKEYTPDIHYATQPKTDETRLGPSIDNTNKAHEKLDPTLEILDSKNGNSKRKLEVFEDLDPSKAVQVQTHVERDIEFGISSHSRKGNTRGNNSAHNFYDEEQLPHRGIEEETTNKRAISRDSVSSPYVRSRLPSDGVKRVATGQAIVAKERRSLDNNMELASSCVVVSDKEVVARRKKSRCDSDDVRKILHERNAMEVEQSRLFGYCEKKMNTKTKTKKMMDVNEEVSTLDFKSRFMCEDHKTQKWDGNGIPNYTNKYKEDQKVSWHDVPFEQRLDQALAKQENLRDEDC